MMANIDHKLQSKDSLLLPSMSFSEERKIIPSGNRKIAVINQLQDWCSCFGSDSGSSSSSLSSPVESELGSTESESDPDEDYTAELTRRMAQFMLQDEPEMKWDSAGSPQSTVGTRIGIHQEEVQNLKKNEDLLNPYKNMERTLNLSLKPTSATSALRTPNSSSHGFHSKQALINEQIRAIQLCKLKQQQQHKEHQHEWGKGRNGYESKENKREYQSKGRRDHSNGRKMRRRVSSSEMMRGMFINGDEIRGSSRNGYCKGTGVFLPPGINGNSCDSRNKSSGYSTVIIPARVVHALKLHFDKMGVESTPNGIFNIFPSLHDGLMKDDVRYGLQLHIAKNCQYSPTMPTTNRPQDIALPHEWTY